MNELQIIDTNGIQTVSARELYKGLEISDRFNRWFESLLKYGFEENQDFTSVKTSTLVNNGAERILDDYSITLDMAKQICMLQRSELGKKYRTYLINLEKAWNEPGAVMARALQIANKTLEDCQKQVAIMQPKAEYFDNYCNSENLEEIGHLGKVTGIGEQKIFKRLLADGIIKVRYSTDNIKSYDPCYGYEKYFKSIPVTFTTNNHTYSRDKLMLTHKGFVYFNAKYASKQTLIETADKFLDRGEKEYQNIVNSTADKIMVNLPGAMSQLAKDANKVYCSLKAE